MVFAIWVSWNKMEPLTNLLQNSVTDFCKVSHSFPNVMLSVLFHKDRAKPFVRYRHTETQTEQRDKQSHKTAFRQPSDRHRYKLIQQTENKMHRDNELEISNLDLLLVK